MPQAFFPKFSVDYDTWSPTFSQEKNHHGNKKDKRNFASIHAIIFIRAGIKNNPLTP